MIPSNELRLGNFVLPPLSDEPIRIDDFTPKGINLAEWDNGSAFATEWTFEEIRPIPLTQKWLEKLGFVEGVDRMSGFLCHTNGFSILFTNDNHWCFFERVAIRPVSWVHQLQNLYFALTSKELTIKETA